MLALVSSALGAKASLTLYNDHALWLAAVSGDPLYTETFDAEHPDLTASTAFNGFTLQALGTYHLGNTHLGGLSEYVDGDTNDKLVLTPVANTKGFGGEFGNFAGGGEGVSMLLTFAGGATFSFDINAYLNGTGGLANQFVGFVSTDPVTSIQFVATTPDGNVGNGDSFSADNFQIAAPRISSVPGPVAAAPFLVATVLRRRRKGSSG